MIKIIINMKALFTVQNLHARLVKFHTRNNSGQSAVFQPNFSFSDQMLKMIERFVPTNFANNTMCATSKLNH